MVGECRNRRAGTRRAGSTVSEPGWRSSGPSAWSAEWSRSSDEKPPGVESGNFGGISARSHRSITLRRLEPMGRSPCGDSSSCESFHWIKGTACVGDAVYCYRAECPFRILFYAVRNRRIFYPALFLLGLPLIWELVLTSPRNLMSRLVGINTRKFFNNAFVIVLWTEDASGSRNWRQGT